MTGRKSTRALLATGDALCEHMFNFTFRAEATSKKRYTRFWATGAKACRKPDGKPETWTKKEKDELEKCQKRREKEGVSIGAYHSYCSTDWQEVATGAG